MSLFLSELENQCDLLADEKVLNQLVGLDSAICPTNSFVFTLGHCMNSKAMRYESKSLNRIVGDKSHVINSLVNHGNYTTTCSVTIRKTGKQID